MSAVTYGWKRTVDEQGSVGFAFAASADHVIISRILFISSRIEYDFDTNICLVLLLAQNARSTIYDKNALPERQYNT